MQQLQLAMQQAPTFAPTRLYLGAALAQANRHREAAEPAAERAGRRRGSGAGRATWRASAGCSAGDAALAIAALEKAVTADGDRPTRTLALAYVVGNRAADAVPLLAKHLESESEGSGGAARRRLRDLCDALAGAAARHARRRSHARAGVGQERTRRTKGAASGAGRRLDRPICKVPNDDARPVVSRSLDAPCRRSSASPPRHRHRARAQQRRQRLITETDLLKFVWIADPQISPDGRQVAFVRVVVNEQKDDYETSLWLVPAERQRAAAATDVGHARLEPALVARRPAPRVRARDRARRPRAAAADLPAVARRRRSARDHRSAARRRAAGVVARRHAHRVLEHDASRRSAAGDRRKTPHAAPKSDVRVITSAVYRSNGGGWNDPERPSHLWVTDVHGRPGRSPKARQLTSGKFSEGGARLVDRRLASLLHLDARRRSVLPAERLGSVRGAGRPAATITKVASIDGTIGNLSVSPDGTSHRVRRARSTGTPERSYSQSDLFVATRCDRRWRAAESDRGLRLRHRRRHRRRSGRAARRRRRAARSGRATARRSSSSPASRATRISCASTSRSGKVVTGVQGHARRAVVHRDRATRTTLVALVSTPTNIGDRRSSLDGRRHADAGRSRASTTISSSKLKLERAGRSLVDQLRRQDAFRAGCCTRPTSTRRRSIRSSSRSTAARTPPTATSSRTSSTGWRPRATSCCSPIRAAAATTGRSSATSSSTAIPATTTRI